MAADHLRSSAFIRGSPSSSRSSLPAEAAAKAGRLRGAAFSLGMGSIARNRYRNVRIRWTNRPLEAFMTAPADRPTLRPATRLAQALGAYDTASGGVVPPIQPATTFLRDSDYKLTGPLNYSRPVGPTHLVAEALLASLEGGAAAMLFGSGMAAAMAVFQALRPGDRVIVPKVMYWALRTWLVNWLRPWGVAVDLADMTDLATVRATLRPGSTKLVWIETPANPTWAVTDIAAMAELAHGAGARLAVDNTVPTPILSRPLSLGADIVMHSCTKYLNGHSDVLSGALVTAKADEHWQRISAVRDNGGAALGPFEAWLLLRGLRTLHLRVRESCANAQAVAEFLQGHRGVEAVLYPGLGNDPGHAVAKRQMSGGFGGMLSVRVKGGRAGALKAAGRLELWKRATSLGGVESLVEHRASVEPPDSPVPPDLLRLSAGIEDAADLIADLDRALGGL
jgi:cystathionine gamma-synthase